MKLAILLTCYNRKENTLHCIRKLIDQLEGSSSDYQFYICDDASTDGTYEELKELLPQGIVVRSSGNLYWCKGMNMVMQMAVQDKYDFYLMINDDVDFYDDAINTMFETYHKVGKSCGVVGATQSMDGKSYTYGGKDINNKLILPSDSLNECVWANWNCFLIDHHVVENVGIIDNKYQHAWGDYDYSYRMRERKYPIVVTVRSIGRCDLNAKDGTYMDNRVGRFRRLKKLLSPKGQPFYSYMRYHMRVYGKRGIIKYIYGYISIIAYIFMKRQL